DGSFDIFREPVRRKPPQGSWVIGGQYFSKHRLKGDVGVEHDTERVCRSRRAARPMGKKKIRRGSGCDLYGGADGVAAARRADAAPSRNVDARGEGNVRGVVLFGGENRDGRE